MKLSRTLLALVVLCTLAAAGCTETVTDPNAPKTTLLTQTTWKTTSYKVDGIDINTDQKAPKTTKFNTNFTYAIVNYDGTPKNGTWEFNVDETNVVMDKGSAGEKNWEILALSATALSLKVTGTPRYDYTAIPE
jgi:hypothetical protein